LHIQPKGTGLVTISDGTDFNKGIRFRSSSSAASAITLLDAVSTAGHVITLPDATTTLVGRNTTDTLTNKSISGATNTFSSIPNSGLTNSSITINGVAVSLGSSTSVGTVTSVTGTAPVVSSGGATPAISMAAATTSVDGYLTSTDWNTFNNKTSNLGTVTSVGGTGTVNGITLTGTVTTSGNLTLGGTLSGVSLTTQVSGTLPVANGGTGTATAFTAGSVVFAGASGVYSQDNASLFFDNTNDRLGIGIASPAYRLSSKQSGNTGAASLGVVSINSANDTVIGIGYDATSDTNRVLASFTSTGAFKPISFWTSDLQRMQIDISGNLLVGTASQIRSGVLSVNGILSTNNNINWGPAGNGGLFSDSNWGCIFTADRASPAIADFMWRNAGGTERMRINSSGIVSMSAYGAGAATFSAAGVISSVSDETWKTKDGVPDKPDEMLQKLQPGYWFYNKEKAPIFGAERQLGFYAQNVNEAIGKEAAPTPEEGKPWGYYDRSVLAIAVMSLKNVLNTIKEQQALITQLQSDVATLKGN
jgi:hypothetical protein